MPPFKNLMGRRFGRWLVLNRNGQHTNGIHIYTCQCDCGTVTDVYSTALRNGSSRSCGCWRDEQAKHRLTTHGKSHTAEYHVWRSMKSRCSRPADGSFGRYGGRGIRVCPRWASSFAAFLKDMGPRPSQHHSIERVDNNGPYAPANCRWATTTEQANNTRTNRVVTFRGHTRTIAEWSRLLSISQKAIRNRIERGWSSERALTTPIAKKRSGTITIGERTQSLTAWLREIGLCTYTYYKRIRQGMSPEEAIDTHMKTDPNQ